MAETSAFSPLSGGYLLIVLTEPHSEHHKQILLERLAKGQPPSIDLSIHSLICRLDLFKTVPDRRELRRIEGLFIVSLNMHGLKIV